MSKELLQGNQGQRNISISHPVVGSLVGQERRDQMPDAMGPNLDMQLPGNSLQQVRKLIRSHPVPLVPRTVALQTEYLVGFQGLEALQSIFAHLQENDPQILVQ